MQSSIQLPPKIIESFARTKEMPWVVSCYELSNSLDGLDQMLLERYVAPEKGSNWQALFAESWLIFDTSEMYAQILSTKADWNVVELAQTNGASLWPLTFELADKNCLAGYVSVTMNDVWNVVSGVRTNQMLKEIGFDQIPVTGIKADLDYDVVKKSVRLHQSKIGKETHNLFVLQASFLSNIGNPGLYLKHIYDSMSEGDMFLICQSIYNSESLQDLAEGFKGLYATSMHNHRLIAADFGEIKSTRLDWEKDGEISSLKIKIKLDKGIDYHGVDLDQGSEIVIFRNSVYERNYLESLFKNSGFRINNMSLNKAQTSSIYLLEK